MQQLELNRFNQRYEEHSDDWAKKFFDVVRQKWNPALAEQRRLEKQQRLDELRTKHRIERETLIETRRIQRDTELEELKFKHGKQVLEQNNRQNAELLPFRLFLLAGRWPQWRAFRSAVTLARHLVGVVFS